MTHESNRGGHPGDPVERLVVVRVEDATEPRLTGRTAVVYESPPQTREQAMTLVRLLVGCGIDANNEWARWTAAIAGGRRVVTLTEEPTEGVRGRGWFGLL